MVKVSAKIIIFTLLTFLVIDVAIGFTITPTDLIVALGMAAVFRCQHPTADAIGWRFNGTTLFGSTLDGVTATTTFVADRIINKLIVSALPYYNQTEVECVAYFDDSPTMHSDVVDLTIQGSMKQNNNTCQTITNIGELAAVGNLIRISTTITWDAPFSLNVTDIDPDIIYCAEVYNITCRRRDLIISDCNVTEPSYTSDALYEGFLYNITVTPRSNVHNTLNGISSTFTGMLLFISHRSLH